MAEEEIDDTTNCPVCFETYTEAGDHVPRLLPCSHSLCEACLKDSIRNGSVNCPQDRKKHRATSGVRTFPQNKYILRNIGKDTEKKEQFETCPQHGKDMMLFCVDDKCKEAICTLCLKDHGGHNVVDVKEKKTMVSMEIKSLRDQLQSFRDEITRAKNDVEKKSNGIKTKVKNRKKVLTCAREGGGTPGRPASKGGWGALDLYWGILPSPGRRGEVVCMNSTRGTVHPPPPQRTGP